MTDVTKPTEVGRVTPKRLSLSEILELVLTRRGEKSSVTLTRASYDYTHIEVSVRTGDDETVEDAERRAREVYDRLSLAYPARPHDNSAVTLTRNAKGETQVDVSIKSSGNGAATIEDAETKAVDVYDRMRGAYPMANGTSAKAGSVA